MAMSRILAQYLPRSSLVPPTSLFGLNRHLSSKSRSGQLIEIEAEQPDSPEAVAEVIALGIRKLEDAMHSIIVRRAAPDWLPLLPGYSYWVPPRISASFHADRSLSAASMVHALGKLASSEMVRSRGPELDFLSEDELKSFSSSKGWPSSAFFLEGTSPAYPLPVVKFEMEVQENDDQVNSQTESEDVQ